MSACTFLASDIPLAEVAPSRDAPLIIDVESGTVYDGDADDNLFLHAFAEVQSYTDKRFGVYLEWCPTEGRARRIVRYLKEALQNTASIELWHVWLTGDHAFENRPVIHRQTISGAELAAKQILEIDAAEIWNMPDKMYPNRPSFSYLKIER